MTPPLEAEPTNPACRVALCSVAIDPKPFIWTADPDAIIIKAPDEGERCWRRSGERFAGVGAQKPP